MEPFEREDPDSIYYHEDLPDDARTLGTPCHRDGQDFHTFMQKFDGYEPDADVYIYVIILERSTDSSTWYYIGKGKGESGLKRRLASHIRKFDNSRPVRQHGEDVLKGGGSALHSVKSEKYRATGVERIASIHYDNLGFDENADYNVGATEAWNQHRSSYAKEKEREMSYTVALDHSTTNILGGK